MARRVRPRFTATPDADDEPDETVIISIANVTNGNEEGDQEQTITILDDDVAPSFTVDSLDAIPSGFVLTLGGVLDASEINLYDTASAAMGAADMLVTGASTGPVTGSFVPGAPGGGGPAVANGTTWTFLASGGPLNADTYTVMLRSAEDGFKDTTGALLDGDGDGTAGGDFEGSFTVEEPDVDTRTIRVPDFVRGPGQNVNLPNDSTLGIPISISNGDGVRAVDLMVSYDPARLEIASARAPASGTAVLNTLTPGLAILVFFSATSLPAEETVFIELEASVPAENGSANYGTSQVIDVHSLLVTDGNDNEFPSTADDAVHLVSFFGDVSGNGRLNAADAAAVARNAALIDGGFVASLTIQPTIIGDISGNGRTNAADASLVAQSAALIEVPEIPAIPAGALAAGVFFQNPRLDPPTTPAQSSSTTRRPAGDSSSGATTPIDGSAWTEDARTIDRAVWEISDPDEVWHSVELTAAVEELLRSH